MNSGRLIPYENTSIVLLIADDAVMFHWHFCFVVFSSVLSLNLGRQSLITQDGQGR